MTESQKEVSHHRGILCKRQSHKVPFSGPVLGKGYIDESVHMVMATHSSHPTIVKVISKEPANSWPSSNLTMRADLAGQKITRQVILRFPAGKVMVNERELPLQNLIAILGFDVNTTPKFGRHGNGIIGRPKSSTEMEL